MAAEYGPRLVVPVDLKKKPWEQSLPLHNRWHPEIPPVAEATAGEFFRVEMIDFSGGRITKNFTADDAKHVDLSAVSSYLLLFIVHAFMCSSISSSFLKFLCSVFGWANFFKRKKI